MPGWANAPMDPRSLHHPMECCCAALWRLERDGRSRADRSARRRHAGGTWPRCHSRPKLAGWLAGRPAGNAPRKGRAGSLLTAGAKPLVGTEQPQHMARVRPAPVPTY